MTQTIADTLDKAAELIQTTGWTQRTHARDQQQRCVAWDDPTAACFCLVGAISRATREGGYSFDHDNDCRIQVENVLRYPHIANWNDQPDRTADEVITKLREAASKAREQGK